MSIPSVNAQALFNAEHAEHKQALLQVEQAALDVGFMTVFNTDITGAQVNQVLDAYRRFFELPVEEKKPFDMASSNSNRGWGGAGAEQVDPEANPDFKEIFDSGPELSPDDPLSQQTYYAANRWPSQPADFAPIVQQYYKSATAVSLQLLSAVAATIGESADYFNDKFDKPMALLRGNFYPPRPATATSRDFGIAPHTDYGCLTLLATDGQAGLEVQHRDGGWIPLQANPGTFIINFGEMLQYWTGGRVVATPHRVIGGEASRMSMPFFFNPRFDVDVAPRGSEKTFLAGDHLSRRYDETYVHQKPFASRTRS